MMKTLYSFVVIAVFFWSAGFTDDLWETHLENMYIHDIAIENDYIWCATDSGVVKYNTVNNSFIRYTTDDGLAGNDVFAVAVDHNNIKWFGVLQYYEQRGVSRFDDTEWTTYIHESWRNSTDIFSVFVDTYNLKWFVTSDGTYSFDDQKWILQSKYHDIPGNMALDQEGILWIVGEGSLLSFDGKIWNSFFDYDEPYSYLSVAVDNNNIKWFGTEVNGIRSFDGANWTDYERVQYYINDSTFAREENIEWIYAAAVDQHNTKWFGSIMGLWSFNDQYWRLHKDDRDQYERVIYDVEIDSNGIIWSAGPNGLYSYHGSTVTSVLKTKEPVEFILFPNHPNPFNPSTTLTYTLPSSGFASLVIYNVTGQKVREFVSDTLTAGTHSFVWDGKDSLGNPVSSGIYFSRLISGKYQATAKMLLIR
ncbi:MAG: T9SS type A sorting domain-containing protein [Candidatus Latescibacteria bacterium]|nr:T9SS type A sorting domain-containing protein [Candidatus Latescibacterota bacterium]